MNAETAAAVYAENFPSEASRERSGAGLSTNPQSESAHWPSPAEEGRLAAFDAALERCRPEVLNYLASRVHDEEAAADLTQEACLRIMKYRGDPQVGNPRLMLFRIANNLLSDFVRYQRRHRASSHIPLEDAGPLFASEAEQEELVVARQTAEAFKRTISELPPKCRLAFMLSRYEGMANAQIAARLEISVKMVEKHIARAIVACRTVAGQCDG